MNLNRAQFFVGNKRSVCYLRMMVEGIYQGKQSGMNAAPLSAGSPPPHNLSQPFHLASVQ